MLAFEQHAAIARHGRDVVRAAGDQAHLAEHLAATQRHQPDVVGVQMNLAVENVVDGGGIVPTIEDGASGLWPDDAAYDGQLAQRHRLHVAEQVNALLNGGERLVHIHAPAGNAKRAELLLQHSVVCGLDLVAEQVFDDLIALVHRMLDQRIARERTDDEHAGDVGLVV